MTKAKTSFMPNCANTSLTTLKSFTLQRLPYALGEKEYVQAFQGHLKRFDNRENITLSWFLRLVHHVVGFGT